MECYKTSQVFETCEVFTNASVNCPLYSGCLAPIVRSRGFEQNTLSSYNHPVEKQTGCCRLRKSPKPLASPHDTRCRRCACHRARLAGSNKTPHPIVELLIMGGLRGAVGVASPAFP